MYSKGLFLLLVCAPFTMYASDGTLEFVPPSPKPKGATLVSAIRRGSPAEYGPLLAELADPLKISYGGRRTSPTRVCIAAIFKRPAEEKLPLIEAFDRHLVQKYPKILSHPCYRNRLPYKYAYGKLNAQNSTQPFVQSLFTVLAHKAAKKQKYTAPAMTCLLALRMLSQDRTQYEQAVEIMRTQPKVTDDINIHLEAFEQDILSIMIKRERTLGAVVTKYVKDVAEVDSGQAFLNLTDVLGELASESVSKADAQHITNDLLFWVASNPHLPPRFVSHLLSCGADPYALRFEGEMITPMQPALQLALTTDGTDAHNALTNLQAMLEVPTANSKNCTLLDNLPGKAKDDKIGQVLADRIEARLCEQIGAAFHDKGLDPFLEHLDLWQTIVTSLNADINGARRSIYTIIIDKPTIDEQINLAATITGRSSFTQFLWAMQTEMFCRMIAHNMAGKRSAFKLNDFITYARVRQVYSKYDITAAQDYTGILYNTLNPMVQSRITALVELHKVV